MDKTVLSQHMRTAYDAAVEMGADDTYTLEAFKVALTYLLSEQDRVLPGSQGRADSVVPSTGRVPAEHQVASDTPEWQRRIALKLGLTGEQVSQIYHLDNDGALRLILNTTILPKNNSHATQDIAVLLSAGRVAAKFDELGTTSDVIKAEVDYYGRLDKSNFSRILGKLKPNFNFNSRDKLLTPRAPGFADAANIAKKYLAVEQGAN